MANPLYKTSLGQKLGPECFSKIRGKFSFERNVEFLEAFLWCYFTFHDILSKKNQFFHQTDSFSGHLTVLGEKCSRARTLLSSGEISSGGPFLKAALDVGSRTRAT